MEAQELLKEIRKRGLTQVQVSERTGITQPTISKLERGDVSDVMGRHYMALLALYDELKKTAEAA